MFRKTAILLARILLKLLFKTEVFGYEKIPSSGGFLLAANHLSFWDPVFLATVFRKRRITFLAKAELFKFAPFGCIIKSLGAMPVNRGARDASTIKGSVELLKNGHVIGIFPEGARIRRGRKSSAKRGAVRMAQIAGVPVIPVHIIGNYKIFSRVRIVAGEPILFSANEKLSEALLLEKSKELVDTIYALDKEC